MDVCVFLALEATELHTQRRLVSGASSLRGCITVGRSLACSSH